MGCLDWPGDMGFLDNLENNLKALESRDEGLDRNARGQWLQVDLAAEDGIQPYVYDVRPK